MSPRPTQPPPPCGTTDKNIRYKTIFKNLVTASMKEDRKTGKWCRNHVCLRDKVAACDLSVCDFDAQESRRLVRQNRGCDIGLTAQ